MIRNMTKFSEFPPAGHDGVFEWDFLNGAFGPSVMPMDFDGVVERNGRFLLFETKSEGVPIPKGQQITLESAQATGFFTIYILRGKTAETIKSAEYWYDNGFRATHKDIDASAIRQECAEWWDYASSEPKPDKVWMLRKFLDQYSKEITDLKKELKLARQEIGRLSCRVDLLERNFSLVPSKAKNRHSQPWFPQLGMFSA